MIKWLIIGVIVWYFYKRFQKKKELNEHNRSGYIRDDDFRGSHPRHTETRVDDDDYIDYEEVN